MKKGVFTVATAAAAFAIAGLIQLTGCGNDDSKPVAGQPATTGPEPSIIEGYWASSNTEINIHNTMYITSQGEVFHFTHALKSNPDYQKKLTTHADDRPEEIRRLNAIADLPALGHLELNKEAQNVYVGHVDVYKQLIAIAYTNPERAQHEMRAVEKDFNENIIVLKLSDQNVNQIEVTVKNIQTGSEKHLIQYRKTAQDIIDSMK